MTPTYALLNGTPQAVTDAGLVHVGCVAEGSKTKEVGVNALIPLDYLHDARWGCIARHPMGVWRAVRADEQDDSN